MTNSGVRHPARPQVRPERKPGMAAGRVADRNGARPGASGTPYMLARHHRLPQPEHRCRALDELPARPTLSDVLPHDPQQEQTRQHWLPASPELQAFLAAIKVRTGQPDSAAHNGKPWESAEQLQKQSSNLLAKLESKGLVGTGLTLHGLRVYVRSGSKRVTGPMTTKWRRRWAIVTPAWARTTPTRRAGKQGTCCS